jgi:N-glycosylase/DNA lyase
MRLAFSFLLVLAGIACGFVSYQLAVKGTEIWGWFLLVALILVGCGVETAEKFITKGEKK